LLRAGPRRDREDRFGSSFGDEGGAKTSKKSFSSRWLR
jgi:hypothetical protein